MYSKLRALSCTPVAHRRTSAAGSRRLRRVRVIASSTSTMTVKETTEEAPLPVKPVTVVSFDVDGTLVRSMGKDANRLHKECFSVGFKEVFGLDTHIDIIPHHGGTDPLIVLKVLQHHEVPAEQAQAKLKDLEAVMVRHFQEHQARAGLGLQLLPGVRQLLETLQARDDVATCLVTGNLEPIGWGKMKALGIDTLFSQPLFGGFGSDHCSGNTQEMWRDRCEFVKLAGKRAAQRTAGGIHACFHVGDTPADIQAALAANSIAIGVTTGVFTRRQLEDCGAGAAPGQVVVLDSLEDISLVMNVLQLQ